MRSLPKLVPGIHPKLPGDSQGHVKGIFEHAEEHKTELNLYITGEEDVEPEPDEESGEELAAEGAAAESERLADEAKEGAGGPPDDQMGGAASPTQESAVGGGAQHTQQASEGGSETARTDAADEPAKEDES
jgi:hypothetical protein